MIIKIVLFFGCAVHGAALPIEPQSQSWMSTVWDILERMINTESNVKRLGEEMKRSQDDVTLALDELKSVNAEIKRTQDNVNAGLQELKNWNAEIQRARDDVTLEMKEIQKSVENRFTTLETELTEYVNKTGKIYKLTHVVTNVFLYAQLQTISTMYTCTLCSFEFNYSF